MHKSLVAAAFLAATARAHAVSEPKVNVYWGQNGETRLRDHCDEANFDYVTIGFVNNSPEQDKSGLNYPGINFGSHCDAIYFTNPLTNLASPLLSKCTVIASDIQYCQEKGKKVLLSVGGAAVTGSSYYSLSSDAKGEEFASFLWGAFGPYDSKWTGPRPFDYAGNHVSVDGFDLDIEVNFSSVGQSAYVALAKKLRELYNGNSKYLLTAAPECPLDDANFKMKSIIANAQFDALFIQFYNNPGCAAASNSGFNYLQWEEAIATGKSKHAKLFIGLPGSSDAADSGYIEPVKAAALINTYKTRASFGGAMIWDVYHGQKMTDGKTFVDAINTAFHGTAKPATAAPAPNAIGCTAYHTVTPGEFCYLIAQNYGITITELIRYNPTMNAACAVQSGQKLCVKQGIVTLASTITSAPAVSSTEAASSSSEAVSTAEFCEDETTTSATVSESASVIVSEPASSTSGTTTEDDSCDVEIIGEDPVGSATESVVVSSTEAPVVSATESAVVSETASVTEPSLISVSFSIEVPTTTDDACEDDTTPSEVPSATEGPSDGSSTAIDLSIITSAPVVIPSGGSSEIISSTTTEDDSCDVEIISEDPVGSATESVIVSSTEAPIVSATGSAVPSDPIDDEIITKDPVGSATESAVPSDVVSESILPSGVVPSGVVPSGVVPSGVVPSGVVPSGV
ncbi:Chitinase 2, partial [Neurospora sp. IMI 360204]